MVAPLNIARGTQNKILEAMAMGVPVVASRVAAAGVDAVPGEHLLVASSPDEYATAILRLMDDSGARGRLATAGRERMLSHHAWHRSMQRLDGIIDSVLSRKCASRAGALRAHSPIAHVTAITGP
jgi:glycosyltransferase involved in cell wall biosynthesis